MQLKLLAVAAAAMAAIHIDFRTVNGKFGLEQTGQINGHIKQAEGIPKMPAELPSEYNFYLGSIGLGNPVQNIDVLLDTGSPITWVFGPETTYQHAKQFHPDNSSTFKTLNQSMMARYGVGQYIGHWGADTVSSLDDSDYSASDFPFGVVSSFSVSAGAPGMLGLGPHVLGAGPANYKTLPEAFYSAGVINSSAFSFYLEGDGGNMLLDGIDTRKFVPPIYSFDSNSTLPDFRDFYSVFLNELSFTDGHDYLVNSRVVLDTGSPMSLVPPGFVRKLGESLNLTLHHKYQAYYTNDSIEQYKDAGSITFRVGMFNLSVPVYDLFVPGRYIWMNDGPSDAKALSLIGAANYLLGDVFFRHAYTIFDPRKRMVYLAQRNWTSPIESESSDYENIDQDNDVGTQNKKNNDDGDNNDNVDVDLEGDDADRFVVSIGDTLETEPGYRAPAGPREMQSMPGVGSAPVPVNARRFEYIRQSLDKISL